ncbi:MAG: hypothetical protein ONB48_15290 [candidate division KSB1 bacterium]|nr:hypothetical protein [candidate division KSB1 bacterium]MDZ7287009.1 hypothetical protein [candidate division KSB1 bacterium]MDZ7299638.1 hypothetical protein [candidate division KSB1 bacterium]MDZ7350785.1 hypothetical protein [candidate division KSB1 bacterium]MDZ7355009.1 hypothetical protein [candidate division KSB1 bacterium]
MRNFRFASMLLLFILFGVDAEQQRGVAQWSSNPSQNLKVAGGGINPEICIDGCGGCFIVWETGTVGNRRLLRMQHLNRYGYKSFPETGIPLASGEFDQSTPFFLTYGGEGTAIVLFYDTRFLASKFVARTLVQRVDTTGTLLWGTSAIRPTQSDSSQTPTALLADGNGGAFVFWAEDRNGDGAQEMFGNRITADGQLLWEQDGRKFADYAYNYIRTQVATDSAGGLFIAYTQISGIVIHHIDGKGQFVWSAPIPMSIGIWGALASDNSGGFFWVAHEQIAYRPPKGPIYRTRAFRYNHAGVSLWPVEGIAITDSAYQQTFTPEVIVNDRQDVAIVYRTLSTPYDNVHVQRITFNGELRFEYGGRPVSTYPAARAIKQTCLGSNRKITVVWRDGRAQKGDLYAQSLDHNGNQIWDDDIAVTLRPDSERSHRISSDGNGGCIVTWYEIGTGSGWGIFAQQVSRNGRLGEVIATSVTSSREGQHTRIPLIFSLFPNPFTDSVRFSVVSTR